MPVGHWWRWGRKDEVAKDGEGAWHMPGARK